MNIKLLSIGVGLLMAAHGHCQTSLTGTWQIAIHADHKIPMGMKITQDADQLSGILTFMGKDIPVKGEFKNGDFSITAEAMMMPHSEPDSKPHRLAFSGRLLEDGTLSGDFPGFQEGAKKMNWTGDRLRQRKARSTESGINGNWVLTTQGERVMEAPMELKQNASEVTGTMLVHGQQVPMIGSFEEGRLGLKNDPAAKANPVGNFEINGTQQADGTLTGSLKSAQGEMRWTAKRP